MGFFRANSATKRRYNRSTIWKLNFKDDIGIGKPAHFAVLHDLAALWATSDLETDNGNLAVHYVRGEPAPPICNLLYFDEDDDNAECDYCKMETSNGFNTPALVKPLICYVFDLVGKERTSKDGTKKYKQDPVKIIEIPCGPSKAHFQEIEDGHNHNYLSIFDNPENLWKMSKLERGFKSPTPVQMRTLGNQFDPKVPDNVLEFYKDKTAGEIQGLILSSYGNLKKDHPMFKELGVVWPQAEEVPETSEEETEDDSGLE